MLDRTCEAAWISTGRFWEVEWVHSGRIRSPLGKPAKQQNRQVIATNLGEVLLQALSVVLDGDCARRG